MVRYRSMPVGNAAGRAVRPAHATGRCPPLPGDDAEMLEQHLDANKDEDYAARNLRGFLPSGAERVSDMQAGGGERAGHHTDDQHLSLIHI